MSTIDFRNARKSGVTKNRFDYTAEFCRIKTFFAGEYYYVVDGQCEFLDNVDWIPIKQGDALIIREIELSTL